MRQFITILTDKYKETKTAPVQAVNKTMTIIIKKNCLPFSQMVDFLIC